MGAHRKPPPPQGKRQPRKMSRSFALDNDPLHLLDGGQPNGRDEDVAIDSMVANSPFSPSHQNPPLSPGGASPMSPSRALSPLGQPTGQISRGSDRVGISFDQAGITPLAHVGDEWDMGPTDMLQPWSWSLGCSQDPPPAGEGPPSGESMNSGLATLGQSIPLSTPDCQQQTHESDSVAESAPDPEADLCQRLADLSRSLCSRAHDVACRVRRGPLAMSAGSTVSGEMATGEGTEHGDAALIELAFKSSEKLRCLLDELRAKGSTTAMPSPGGGGGGTGMLTPCNTLPTAATGGGGGTPDSGGPSGAHLGMILGLHVATAYVALNGVLQHALRGVHASGARSSGASGGRAGAPLAAGEGRQRLSIPRLPRMRIAGLACVDDDDGLRARLLAET